MNDLSQDSSGKAGQANRETDWPEKHPQTSNCPGPQEGKCQQDSPGSGAGQACQTKAKSQRPTYYLLLPLRVNSITETSEAGLGLGSCLYFSLPLYAWPSELVS